MKKIIGKKYPAKCLINYKTGKPIMIEHTKYSNEIRRIARESADNLLKAISDKTGLTSI